MNLYRLSYIVRTPCGRLSAETVQVWAPCATLAILQIEDALGVVERVGPLTWSLVGPSLSRETDRLAA